MHIQRLDPPPTSPTRKGQIRTPHATLHTSIWPTEYGFGHETSLGDVFVFPASVPELVFQVSTGPLLLSFDCIVGFSFRSFSVSFHFVPFPFRLHWPRDLLLHDIKFFVAYCSWYICDLDGSWY